MIVELISVGTEILLGNIVNTNAQYISERCAFLGYSIFYQSVVGDNNERLTSLLEEGLNRSDILILTGGLGPTKDDLTKEAVAQVMGKKLVKDQDTIDRLHVFFSRLQASGEMPENNLRQAFIPEGSHILTNENGTAPGIIVEEKGKAIILLPGPPNEMVPMFEKSVVPYLMNKQTNTIHSVMVKLCGIGESKAEELLMELIESQSNPTVAPYAKTGEVHIRITAREKNKKKAEEIIHPILQSIKSILGPYIYTLDEAMTLEGAIFDTMRTKGMTISTAESCSGGLLAGRLVNTSGASDVFKEGFVVYSNQAKNSTLGVSETILNEFGAVSRETAAAMATRCAEKANTDVAVAITGIAGPEGGTSDKPVGLVYIACFCNGETQVKKYIFNGNRQRIRESSVSAALTLLFQTIQLI